MSRILGLDTSGNLGYFGVIIGEKEDLRRLYSQLTSLVRRYHIHMSKMKGDEKKAIISFLANRSKELEIFAGCIKINFWRRINRYAGVFRSKKKARRRVYREILVRIADICTYAGIPTGRITEVHLDQELKDMETPLREFFPNASIIIKGFASELADIIAYINFTSSDTIFSSSCNFLYIRM